MAKKDRNSKAKGRAQGKGIQRQSAEPIAFDRRAMEGVMRQLTGPPAESRTPLDAAQDIMYEAFEAASSQRKMALARRALEMSPDCADAYVLLAEYAPTLQEAIELCAQGVAAGERALGKKAFREYEGEFWGFLETRPYMRARAGLAERLWAAGRRDEAVEHYREMLRLNPGDNQGIRYRLASALLQLERHDELQNLLDQYTDDAMADWLYTRALLAFRCEGDSNAARKLLVAAQQTNQHVPAYITGDKRLPEQLPTYISWGGEDEAVSYAAEHMPAWKNTSGAVTWLRKSLKVPLGVGSERKTNAPAWPKLRPLLARLPQDGSDVWQLDLRSLAPPPDVEGSADTLWALIVGSAAHGNVFVFETFEERPADGEVWRHLLQVMQEPQDENPFRPGEIQVSRKAWRIAWGAKLEQIGITCRLIEELDYIDHVVEQMSDSAARLAVDRPLTDDTWNEIAGLPQHAGEVWQADVRRMPAWVVIAGEPCRPWLMMVLDTTNGLILATEMMREEPDAQTLLKGVCGAICSPSVGAAHRPGVVQVDSDAKRARLAERLSPDDIRIVVSDELESLTRVIGEMSEHVGGKSPPSLLNSPGVTTGQLASLYAAAAEFYRRAPWRAVPSDTRIQVECDQFQSGPWHAVVMGQSGIQLGLAIYDDLGALESIMSDDLSDEERAQNSSVLSLLYSEAFELAARELDAAERHGWIVAGPEAYPLVMRVNPGMTLRTPLKWELLLLEACLRAMPDYLAHQTQQESLAVTAAGDSLTLRLSRMDRS